MKVVSLRWQDADNPPMLIRMAAVTRTTRLSELRRQLVGDTRSTDGQLNPQLVRSIQQSLAVEGYDVSEEVVRAAGKRVEG
jgi:hypothetical protein